MAMTHTRMTPLALLVTLVSMHDVAAQVPGTLQMRVAWEVSEGNHPTADSLDIITGVAMDRASVVYASDGAAAKIDIALFLTPVLSLSDVAAVAVDPYTGVHTILRFGPVSRR